MNLIKNFWLSYKFIELFFFKKKFCNKMSLFSKKNRKVVITGLESSGKTTFLYNLKLNEIITTIPTIGFNIESIKLCNRNYDFWEFGQSNNKYDSLFFSGNQEEYAGIIHLCRDDSKENIKFFNNLIENLQQKGFSLPILVLFNPDQGSDSYDVFQRFKSDCEVQIKYSGDIKYEILSVFSNDIPNFLEVHFVPL